MHALSSPSQLPVIVIPAFQPNQALAELVSEIRKQNAVIPIVVIDDGSTQEATQYFNMLADVPHVEILRHAVNLGKGQALKTAFNHVLVSYPDAIGVVTADADGQHAPEDILRITHHLQTHPNTLHLGKREFTQNIPLRSRVGNKLTRFLFKILVGTGIRDTQTGLRAIPRNFLAETLHIQQNGYEFELEMLILGVRRGLHIQEIPIQTLYIDNNSSSHFHPLLDSLKIYFVFFRFSALALTTTGLDFLVFSSVYFFCQSILTSIIIARIIAGSYNFIFGKLLVFRSRGKILPEALKYALTVLVLMLISYICINHMASAWGLNVIVSKAIVESSLFFVSFSVLNTFVFKRCV